MFDRLTELIGGDGQAGTHSHQWSFISGLAPVPVASGPAARLLPTVCLVAAWLSFDVLAAAGLFGLLSVLIR
jgi:hypothetical protein